MELKKHTDQFSSRMQLLDKTADKQLAKELIQMHEKKCTACQDDRLRCATRPACKDRNFLNTMIEIGVEPEDLPAFCYSQNIEQIRRFILERKGRKVSDRRFPIKDLLQTLSVNSIRHFTAKFKKIWSNFSQEQEKTVMLVAGDGLLFRFDFHRGIVTVNPSKDRIDNFDVFKLYCKLFSKLYELPSAVTDVTSNWWVLSIAVEGADSAGIRNIQRSKLANAFEAMYSKEVEDKVHLDVEIIQSEGHSALMAEQLQELFESASKLSK
ncbi:MAG: hypothetical protein ACTSWA_10055 [Candidatus Thorarchaeota archaeon]